MGLHVPKCAFTCGGVNTCEEMWCLSVSLVSEFERFLIGQCYTLEVAHEDAAGS